MPEAGEKIRLVLDAGRGESRTALGTRAHIGEIKDNKVTYHWDATDHVGVLPLNLQDSEPNYDTEVVTILDDNNYATFETYITSDGFETEAPHLLIYYPYNSSMLQATTGSTGAEYAKAGLTFHLPQIQDQYGYNKTINAEDHPSAWALSHYGLAYDLATSQASNVGNQQTLQGKFTLDHANAYMQFNVFGSEYDGINYGDGTWRISSMTVEAGHCEVGSSNATTVYDFTDLVHLAGTYTFKYSYDPDNFNNVSLNNNNDLIKLSHTHTNTYANDESAGTHSGITSVVVNMHNAVDNDGAKIGDDEEDGVPAFVVINGQDILENPKGNLNCLKVAVTAHKYNAEGKVIDSQRKIRYYDISTIVETDISGNYYTIPYDFSGPFEEYTDLCKIGTANSYIISVPGNYSFRVDIAGNTVLPSMSDLFDNQPMGVNPTQLMDPDKTYAVDWLWASGLSFEAVDNGNMTDQQVFEKIVQKVQISGQAAQVSIGQDEDGVTDLSGNIVVALYETDENGTYGDIVWTWHLWLTKVKDQYFRFPATNIDFSFTNEEWNVMDRNMGAESAELGDPRSAGLYYQRGRKEPIIGYDSYLGDDDWTENHLKTYVNTKFNNEYGYRAVWQAGLEYEDFNTLKYPMALVAGVDYSTGYTGDNITSGSPYTFAWIRAQNVSNQYDITNDTKTMFDPCPPGYRLPTVREWDNFKSDVHLFISNVKGNGMWGYCQYEKLADHIPESNLAYTEEGDPRTNPHTDPRNVDYLARIEGGDFYTVNSQFERTYYVNKYSGTGSTIKTTFPNTGVLRAADGTWKYLYDNAIPSGTTRRGPEFISLQKVDGYLSVRFTELAYQYGYSQSKGGTITWVTNRQWGENLSYWIGDSGTIYFYMMDFQGKISEPTEVIVNGTNITYTRGGTDYETATMALWSAGRVDGGDGYLTYWFGPADSEGTTLWIDDEWNKEGIEDYRESDGSLVAAPYIESRETYGITYEPNELGRYSYSDQRALDPAIPVRCIREYDVHSSM